jgi:hypothetical protein
VATGPSGQALLTMMMAPTTGQVAPSEPSIATVDACAVEQAQADATPSIAVVTLEAMVTRARPTVAQSATSTAEEMGRPSEEGEPVSCVASET